MRVLIDYFLTSCYICLISCGGESTNHKPIIPVDTNHTGCDTALTPKISDLTIQIVEDSLKGEDIKKSNPKKKSCEERVREYEEFLKSNLNNKASEKFKKEEKKLTFDPHWLKCLDSIPDLRVKVDSIELNFYKGNDEE